MRYYNFGNTTFNDFFCFYHIFTNSCCFYYDINMNGTPDISIAGGYPVNPGDPGAGSRTPVTQITEYDPDYDARGVQSLTSLGEAGPAPIRFFDMPEIFRVPPQPEIFQRREAYNLRGRVIDWNDREQVVHGDFPGGLKDIDTTNPTVRSELIRVYSDWVLKLDLDGFRIDTVKHVEHEFWQVFARDVRARLAAAGKDRFLMFGEAFDGDDALVGSYTRPGELDSVFYFPQKFQVFDDVFANGGATSKIADLHAQRPINYGTEIQPGGIGIAPHRALVNFIDNHDVPRFLWRQPDTRALRAAMGFLMFEEGIPCLYYGTEQELRGQGGGGSREPLWETGYRRDTPTWQWITHLLALRRELAALSDGDLTVRFASEEDGFSDAPDAGLLAYERRDGEGRALVVLNAHALKRSQATVPTGFTRGTSLRDRLGGGGTLRVDESGAVDVDLGPREALLLTE